MIRYELQFNPLSKRYEVAEVINNKIIRIAFETISNLEAIKFKDALNVCIRDIRRQIESVIQ